MEERALRWFSSNGYNLDSWGLKDSELKSEEKHITFICFFFFNISHLDESKDIILPWLKRVGKWWEKWKIFNQMVLWGKRRKPNIYITNENVRQRQ